jgi:hypothetical protein
MNEREEETWKGMTDGQIKGMGKEYERKYG